MDIQTGARIHVYKGIEIWPLKKSIISVPHDFSALYVLYVAT